MSRRILQIVLIIVGSILVITSLLGIIAGAADKFFMTNMSNAIDGNVILDSNYRFYSGSTLGLGLVIFWIIPSIEKHKIVLRLLSIMIFFGAMGRLVSVFTFTMPSIPFVIFTIMELFFPLIILWHAKIANAIQE
jgi:hypothetical protein